jgi:hypothetical protein
LITGTLVLQNNSGDDLTLTANGSFTFATALADAAAYSVAISTQPTNMTCTVTNGSGTIASANVTSVTVSCTSAVKLIFITAATTTGNIKGSSSGTDIAAADALCAADTNKPDDGTYKAMIVSGTTRRACTTIACSGGGTGENIDWVFAASTAYYRPDLTTKIGTTTTGAVFNLIVGFDNSFSDTAYNIWTGMIGDWTTAGDTCSSWSSASAAAAAPYGLSTEKTASPISVGTLPCNTNNYLARIEQ